MKKIKYIIFPLAVFAAILVSQLSLSAAIEEGDGPWPLIFCVDNFVDNRSETDKTANPISKDDLMMKYIGVDYTTGTWTGTTKDGNCANIGQIKKGAKATISFWVYPSGGQGNPTQVKLEGLENIDIWTNAPNQTLTGTGVTADGKNIRAQLTIWTNVKDNDAGFEKIIEIHNFMIGPANN